MLLGCIADDFTGASDIANTLAKAGMHTVQTVGIPAKGFSVTADACVISLKSRSISVADSVHQSLESLHWLLAQGCQQIIFKYCSTFDSTREGNIGPVAEALAKTMGVKGVVVCPAFPGAGRRIYQGHLFVNDRLLNESGMEKHPLNPMTDADIRRWLQHQAKDPVGLVRHDVVSEGAGAIRAALEAEAQAGHTLVVVDAGADKDLFAIGAALADARLVTGGSGIAMGLPKNFENKGLIRFQTPEPVSMRGPAAILSGSCSRATLGQIEHHKTAGHPVMAISIEALLQGKVTPADAVAFCKTHSTGLPLVCSSEAPDEVARHQKTHGTARVAGAIEHFFAETAALLVQSGVKRLVVAGGETSGAVVGGLSPKAFRIGPEIAAGVPALACIGEPDIGLALKSGNFGQPDFFVRAAQALGS
ncbi:MAG: 3-oxo-tetronate kinase [Beijerinckiaceae bacterium]